MYQASLIHRVRQKLFLSPCGRERGCQERDLNKARYTVAPTVMPVPTPKHTAYISMALVKVPLVSFSTVCGEE